MATPQKSLFVPKINKKELRRNTSRELIKWFSKWGQTGTLKSECIYNEIRKLNAATQLKVQTERLLDNA